jgi:hypothetical protein
MLPRQRSGDDWSILPMIQARTSELGGVRFVLAPGVHGVLTSGFNLISPGKIKNKLAATILPVSGLLGVVAFIHLFDCLARLEFPESERMDLKAYLKSRQQKIDRALDQYLPKEKIKPATGFSANA